MGIKEFKEKLAADSAFAAEFKGLDKPSEVVAKANAKGYNISTADLKADLSDDDLDAIAGGGHIIGAKFFVTNVN